MVFQVLPDGGSFLKLMQVKLGYVEQSRNVISNRAIFKNRFRVVRATYSESGRKTICALLLLLAVVGSYGQFFPFGRDRNTEGLAEYKAEYYEPVRIVKRAADDKTGTKSSDDAKDAGGTTESSTTPKSTKSDSGTTTTTVTPASSSKTTPKPTDATTEPSTEATTKSTSSKPLLASRSAFENKDNPSSKPSDNGKKPESLGNEKEPSVAPRKSPDNETPSSSTGSNPTGPNVGSAFQQTGDPFPGYNSIPSYGPNYAFTSTNHGPGGSASASAGSFASAGGFPSNPGFPSFDSRGAFVGGYPNYNPNGYAPGNSWPTNPRKPTNDVPQDKPVTNSRSNFDTNDKPANDVSPAYNPNSLGFNTPQNFPGRSFGGPYTPNFDYPAASSVQGPNYAWTNSGPGFSGAAAGAFAGSAGAPTFGSRGAFPDNNARAGFPDNSAYVPGAVDPGFGFSHPVFGSSFDDSFAIHQRIMEEHFRNIQAQIDAHHRAIQEANKLGSDGAGSSEPGVHSAIAGISLGPRGGFQMGQISPAAPGIESRFADDLPPISGGNVGVFASSSSSSMTGPDGKTIAHKSATTGVNDNGKISFRTVQD
ncbi:hypothetical protein KPH14_009757 [Odynerus spinipes]|uniref:Uncharacterized protein n=1 Tax=Odynerus spinipes TaxID=1348599 RepID=A0AAD9RFM6_9HYME|nr:hypothetical protein KPH14_009757 [Odynerus spinipes]